MAVKTSGGIYALPEDCIANALSLTTPKDAARLSAVASIFRSASSSDTVWERFLPSDHREILSRVVVGLDSLLRKSKKELYLHLCDYPVLIDGGLKSFSLDKMSGKKCFMISARDLYIVWSDTPQYWQWLSVPESRFSEVAELKDVCWLEIKGKINTAMLSPNTKYAAYLVFNTTLDIRGFEYRPTEAFLVFNGHESERCNIRLDPESVLMQRYATIRVRPFYHQIGDMLRRHQEEEVDADSDENTGKLPRQRGDGWMEVELGECFVQDGENGDLEMCVMEIKGGNWKRGIIVEGIEIRPKEEET